MLQLNELQKWLSIVPNVFLVDLQGFIPIYIFISVITLRSGFSLKLV